MIAAVPWHYWLGLVLLIAGVGSIVAYIVGYLKSVTALKYPNRKQRQSQN
jgi:uncharacterized membrane protein